MSKKCSHKYWGAFGDPVCSMTAKVEREGAWYCGIHDPMAIKQREGAKSAAFNDELNKRAAEKHSEAQARAEIARRAGCYDDLLEACSRLVGVMNLLDYENDHTTEFARAAIAKATGETE